LRSGPQHDFPVLEGSAVVGLLARDDVLRTIAHGGMDQRVDEVMRRDCLEVRDDEMLSEVLRRMREHQCSALAVVRHGRLVGLLTLENVGKLMLIHAAVSRRQGSPPAG
jgi:IMP dehydrogenase